MTERVHDPTHSIAEILIRDRKHFGCSGTDSPPLQRIGVHDEQVDPDGAATKRLRTEVPVLG
ncbi:MAG: hypothetical protein E6J09_13250 [Chloroflexi bacterium]|nr:MAG: hypothetical protein E6J09_13250 [Chloroflexota bacterium]